MDCPGSVLHTCHFRSWGEGHKVGALEADSLSVNSLLPSLLATCGVMSPSSGLNNMLSTYCLQDILQ